MAHFCWAARLLPLCALLVAAQQNTTAANTSVRPLECETARAPDYYGLGNRLGTYFLWLSAYIANTMLPSEISGQLDANSIFLFANLIAFIRCTLSNMIQQVDALILMHISGGTIFGVLSMWGYRTLRYTTEGPSAIKYFGGFGTHCRLLLSLAISSYGLWFWMFGITGGLRANAPPGEEQNPVECEELYTFMFAKVHARGGIRIFYIFVCVCCTIVYGLMTLASTLAGFERGRKLLRLWKNKQYANSSRLRFATGFNYGELHFIFRFWRWWSLIFLIYSAFLVEFTLNFNHIRGVLGGPYDNEIHLPSQILPLLIGAFSFIRVCWLTFSAWRTPPEPTPSVSNSSEDSPRRSRTIRMGLSYLQLFSPALAADAPKPQEHSKTEVDPKEKRKSRIVRYFVAMLPWFSLLRYFGDRDGDVEAAPVVQKKIELEDDSSPEPSPTMKEKHDSVQHEGRMKEMSPGRHKTDKVARKDHA